MRIEKQYIRFPVNRECGKIMKMMQEENELYSFCISYDPQYPAYYVYADVSPWVGRDVLFVYNGAQIDVLEATDTISPDRMENKRPLIHFTSPWGWINDPNGLSYYNGEYHLFCQHNPFGNEWGNMHWGHATSQNLIDWQWKKEALYPNRVDATMFSGSGVVDRNNTAGLGEGAHILVYTCADEVNGFTQNLAWSCDGEHYSKYENNPVISNLAPGNRDPKVIWHEPTKSWILALYLENDIFALFSSKNLIVWKELERFHFEGANECPDFFPLKTPEGETKWILWEAGGRYLIGDFDGCHFQFERKIRSFTPRDAETRAYASQSFSDEPKNRRLMVFWETVKFPGAGFNSQYSLPLELKLIRINGELMISSELPDEITERFCSPGPHKALFIEADLRKQVEVDGVPLLWTSGTLQIDGKRYPVNSPEVKLILDRASIEIFAENGTKLYVHEGDFPLSGKYIHTEKVNAIC